jgi:hypothetical protein
MNLEVSKPCWILDYCPYGELVEEFSLPEQLEDPKACLIFGHICPVFCVAEEMSERSESEE